MTQTSKAEIIKIKWAETVQHVITLTDEELIQRITEYERTHVEAQTALECARHEAKRRADSMKGEIAERQRELDRKYQPKPQDRVEFDKKAKAEKISLSKDEKAIQTMMSFGLSRDEAVKRFNDAKAGKK